MATRVPRQCPLVILVKLGGTESKIFAGEDGLTSYRLLKQVGFKRLVLAAGNRDATTTEQFVGVRLLKTRLLTLAEVT